MLKPFRAKKILSPVEMGPKMAVLGENGGRNLRFWFRNPQKALPCAEPRRLTYFASKSVGASKKSSRRTETPKPIRIKFCMVVDIPTQLPPQILVTIG